MLQGSDAARQPDRGVLKAERWLLLQPGASRSVAVSGRPPDRPVVLILSFAIHGVACAGALQSGDIRAWGFPDSRRGLLQVRPT